MANGLSRSLRPSALASTSARSTVHPSALTRLIIQRAAARPPAAQCTYAGVFVGLVTAATKLSINFGIRRLHVERQMHVVHACRLDRRALFLNERAFLGGQAKVDHRLEPHVLDLSDRFGLRRPSARDRRFELGECRDAGDVFLDDLRGGHARDSQHDDRLPSEQNKKRGFMGRIICRDALRTRQRPRGSRERYGVAYEMGFLCRLKSIRAWLGADRQDSQEFAPLRETLDALDHLEPDRARYLAAFAYLLGRVAHADQHVSTEETLAMEVLVQEHGQVSRDQAMVVVQLAKASNLLFGGTANFLVARELSTLATYEQKLALMRCLFAVSATDEAISTAEEGEIHRIAKELRIDHPDLVALRVAHQRHLPGISRK